MCARLHVTPSTRINTGKTLVQCLGSTAPSVLNYEVRACVRLARWVCEGNVLTAARCVCVCVRALLAQCWAFRSLTIELNGSAVHAQFPDWPANEAVPIVELMQLPIQTNGWVSRGVNSSLVNVSVSTDGVRTNCACGACAPRKCCALCTYGGSDAACLFSLPHSHAPTGRRPRADCDVLERRGVAGLPAAVDRPDHADAAPAASAAAAAFAAAKASAAAGGHSIATAVAAKSASDDSAAAAAATANAGPATDTAAASSAPSAAAAAAAAKPAAAEPVAESAATKFAAASKPRASDFTSGHVFVAFAIASTAWLIHTAYHGAAESPVPAAAAPTACGVNDRATSGHAAARIAA